MPDTVVVRTEVYEALLKDRDQLRHLEAMGVDNWEGYSTIDDEAEDEEEDE